MSRPRRTRCRGHRAQIDQVERSAAACRPDRQGDRHANIRCRGYTARHRHSRTTCESAYGGHDIRFCRGTRHERPCGRVNCGRCADHAGRGGADVAPAAEVAPAVADTQPPAPVSRAMETLKAVDWGNLIAVRPAHYAGYTAPPKDGPRFSVPSSMWRNSVTSTVLPPTAAMCVVNSWSSP